MRDSLGVLGLAVLGILILSSIAVFRAPLTFNDVQVTGLLHANLAEGVKEYRISVMNTGENAKFCQGVINVTKNGILLKSIKENAGLLQPGQEIQVVIRVKVPLGAEAIVGTFCTT
ncbi:MAG: hypothetical protein AABX51_00550 [Nanoarchaeota archaeon]